VARPKRQDGRRRELVAAAQRAIVRFGADGALLQRIAAEAGLAPQTVSYYYPDISALVTDAVRQAMDRFYTERAAAVEAFQGSTPQRLRLLIEHGLPTGVDDDDVRMLCELGGAAARMPSVAALLSTLFDREVSLYVVLLERGSSEGVFALRMQAEQAAQNLVSLEDAYGYRVMGGHPSITPGRATDLVVAMAEVIVGCPLPAISRDST